MSDSRLPDYLSHMREAAENACGFVRGMEKDGFQAFTQAHPEVPWRNMRGMRNRITHGYFDINLDVVWDTVQAALPELLRVLNTMPGDATSQ